MFSSKHVVFGHVVSGETVVDMIENVSVDPNSNRPLKDIFISHCGQLDIVRSKTITKQKKRKTYLIRFIESNKSKKRKLSTGDENDEDNNDDENHSTTDNDEKKKKSKHNKKSKRKEKHRKKKQTKHLARSTEDKNDVDNSMNEISRRDNIDHKSTIDSDVISEQKLHSQTSLNDKEKVNNDETTINNERISRYEVNSYFFIR